VKVTGIWKWDRRGEQQNGENIYSIYNFTCLTDFVYLLLIRIFYRGINFTFDFKKYIISLTYIMYTVSLWMKFYSFTSTSFVYLLDAIFCHCSYDRISKSWINIIGLHNSITLRFNVFSLYYLVIACEVQTCNDFQ
jgi:hypothetical protein